MLRCAYEDCSAPVGEHEWLYGGGRILIQHGRLWFAGRGQDDKVSLSPSQTSFRFGSGDEPRYIYVCASHVPMFFAARDMALA